MPLLHNLQGLVPIHIPVQIQWIKVPGIGDLYLGIGHLGHLKNPQHHILSIAIRVIYASLDARGQGGARSDVRT